jgi:hypothetical protein
MRAAALVVTLALVPVLAVARADDKKDDKKPEGMDKKALEVVKEVGNLYKNAKSLHADVKITAVATDGEEKRESAVAGTVDFARPNRLALHVKGDKKDAGVYVVSDGKKLSAFIRRLNEYTEADAPTDMGDFSQALLRFGPGNVGILMANVLTDDPYETLMMGVNGVAYAGKEDVGGTSAHHLKFTQDQFDWELWVAAEGKPAVLKVVMTVSAGDRKAVTTETYKDWKFDDTPAKDAFSFTPPEGAKKVDEFTRQQPGGE